MIRECPTDDVNVFKDYKTDPNRLEPVANELQEVGKKSADIN